MLARSKADLLPWLAVLARNLYRLWFSYPEVMGITCEGSEALIHYWLTTLKE
jgi:hypothetical protein